MPATITRENVDIPSVDAIFGKYFDKEIYLALNRERTKVVATGSTPKTAFRNARRNGYRFAVIVKAPKKDIHGLLL